MNMSLINQSGYYHGVIVDGGLSQSTGGGFPQEVLELRANQVYDPEGQEYLPADPENNEIRAYLVLIDSKDRETLNCKQLKKVIDWDGASLVALSEMDLAETPIAFRVEERTYNGNTSLQVTWIDDLEASPTRTVQKLAKEGVVALQQRYASVLASTKAPAKPVSAKAPAKPKASKPKATPKPPKAPAKPKAPASGKSVGKCTADEAYNECFQLKRDDVTEDQLNDIWLDTIGDRDETKMSSEEWFAVKEVVLREVSKV
jgi:hypothetical protein